MSSAKRELTVAESEALLLVSLRLTRFSKSFRGDDLDKIKRATALACAALVKAAESVGCEGMMKAVFEKVEALDARE